MNKGNLIDAAMGRIPCDLLLENAKIVDLLGHRIIEGNIAVYEGTVVGCGDIDLPAKERIDLKHKFVSPAFTDAHVHIESSMVIPSQYARLVIPKGVATVIADPHEIANVCGSSGLDFMIEDKSPLRTYYMLPSCVPATPFDSSGAVLDGTECKKLWESGKFLGLGEMMNYPGVAAGDKDTVSKLTLTDKIDGHAPMLRGKELQAYVCAGISNDHECSSAEEALEKISLGLNIYIREGTGAKNLEELIKAVTPYNMHRFAFCTDDKHIDEIYEEGTISHCVAKAIKLGMEPLTAFTIGCLNAPRFYGLKGLGAIAPGYAADLIIMEELNPETITDVYLRGVRYEDKAIPAPDISKVSGTVHIKPIATEDIKPVFNHDTPVIDACPGTLITKPCYPESTEGLMICANIERHKATGRLSSAYVKGFSIKNGAVAQTIGHDSHNITVMGDNTQDMAAAVNALGADGGITVVKDGEVIASLTLEVAGLMSSADYMTILEGNRRLTEGIAKISSDEPSSLLMILSFLSLLVIPEIKISDKGLFDVNKFEFI